jgi:hypothetical protein
VLLRVRAGCSVMTTLYRRRQYRDRRDQPTLADLVDADVIIGAQCFVAGFFFFALLMFVFFGERFLAIFGG